MTDPIILAAQARPMLEKLHLRNDVVVRFKTDHSGYAEDELDDLDRVAPGHFRADRAHLTLNLDTLAGVNRETGRPKPTPSNLSDIESWRKYPVLAGVAAHESAHARWSLWDSEDNPIPDEIPNPDYDPDHPSPTGPDGEPDPDYAGPETFSTRENGRLHDLARKLEEPRVERLGMGHFSKTWRRAMQMSVSHLILESIDEDDDKGTLALDAATNLAILIGGRLAAGTLGFDHKSRMSAKRVLSSAQKIIEEALPDADDPFHAISGIVSEVVFSDRHTDNEFMLNAARRILAIIHPEDANDPDSGSSTGGSGSGEGEDDEDGGGGGKQDSAAMQEMARAMKEAAGGMAEEMAPTIEAESRNPSTSAQENGGYGSIMYQNPQAPQIDRYEEPNTHDRELYRRALAWMERQIQPTVTEFEVGQWLPTGGARLDVRSYVRDNLAGHRGSQRTDWERVSETVKPAPPVKVAIMLDGSGSMSRMARPSASIAWAAANAAAQLPESRTVSVVYGDAAQVTQAPGHLPARKVAVSRTDGGTEDFIGAAQMVTEALYLDEPVEEGEPTNVLIIIVSDLMYGGSHPQYRETQQKGFARITREWVDQGFNVVVIGAHPTRVQPDSPFTVVKPEELFR